MDICPSPFDAGGTVRQNHRPATPPKAIAPIWATDEELNRMIKATMTAIDARSRSGQSVRAIPQTACATIATATSLRPCSSPAPTGPRRRLRAVSKEEEQYGGWKREGNPPSKTAEVAAPHQPNGKSNLAAGRTRQKLAQRNEIGEYVFVEPAASDNKLLSEIANVGNRSTKARYAKFAESEQHLQWRTGSIVLLNSFCIHSDRSPASCTRSPIRSD